LRVSSAALALTLCLAVIFPAVVHAVPPPPPPPDVLARIEADCRMAPRETVTLAKSVVPTPRAPAQLNVAWAMRLTPPPGAQLGTIVGLTRTWSGSIVAATDRGYWIRVPSEHDEALAPQPGPVAVPIRDLAGSPDQMAFAGWSGEPGYVGVEVLLAVAQQPTLMRYEIGGCFPGARGRPGPAAPPGQGIFRLEPAADGAAQILVRLPDGSVREGTMLAYGAARGAPRAVGPLVSAATSSARIELAQGCDELTFHREQTGTLLRTSCSQGYLSTLRDVWERPQRQHRQPPPISGTRTLGRIEARVVAVSDARYDWARRTLSAVRRGDRSDPGIGCSFMVAAQEGADAPIFIYGLQTHCAYYPRDPSGAPFPPPPPP
jgi:hypothetical protein